MLNWDEYGKEENNVPQVTAEVKTNESIQTFYTFSFYLIFYQKLHIFIKRILLITFYILLVKKLYHQYILLSTSTYIL